MPDLALRLMEERDIERASRIIIKAHEWYHDFSVYPEQLEESISLLKKPMEHSLEGGVVYTLGFRNSELVGVYQLPSFFKKGSVLESIGDAYFATEPEGQGVGNKYLERLGAIFSRTAFSADAESLLHKVVTRRRSPLYERRGYRLTGTRDVVRWMHYHYEGLYPAAHLELSKQEEQITQTLVSRILVTGN